MAREAGFLHDMYLRPCDACFFKIIDSAALRQPIRVRFRERLAEDQRGRYSATQALASGSLAHHVFMPSFEGDVQNLLLDNGQSVSAKLAMWGHAGLPLACVVPEPIASIMVASRYPWLMLLARSPKSIGLASLFGGRQDIFPPQWLETARSVHAPVFFFFMRNRAMYKHLIKARRASFDCEGLSTAVGQLRGLALQAKSDQERAAIQKSMLYLEDLGATLGGKAFSTERQLAAQHIREGLLLLTLKSSVGLRGVVKKSLEMCFPGSVSMPNMNSYNSHRESQFKIDMTLALTERDSLMLERRIRWGWGDSSPQSPYDWFLWRYRYVFQSRLLDVYNAMKTLALTTGGSLKPTDEHGNDEGLGQCIDDLPVRAAANRVLFENVHEHLMA